jgi:hypothetical protein
MRGRACCRGARPKIRVLRILTAIPELVSESEQNGRVGNQAN